MPTLRERLENNIVIVVSTFAIGGFITGFGARNAVGGTSATSEQAVDWQATARQKGWIDRAACPAMPVTLRLLSPGSEATVRQSKGGYVHSDVVISSSQALPQVNAVGYVVKAEGDTNYYVMFPSFNTSDDRLIFRESIFSLPFTVDKPTHVDMWALVIEDQKMLGSVYGSLDQIKAISNTIFMSEMAGITVAPEP